MDAVYKKIYELKRPDPSIKEKGTTKKPSHSTTDMHHFMIGLRKNLSAEGSVLKCLRLIKVRPTMGARARDPASNETLLTKKGKDAWDHLMCGIAQSPSLQILRIWHCSIGADVIKTLAEALRINTTLQILDLSYNNMPDFLGPQLV